MDRERERSREGEAPVTALAKIMERNISALLERRRRENERESFADRVARGVTHFAGSMLFVVLHLILVSLWILLNVGILPISPFDPSFTILGMTASVEAIFLTTFVLITQNRMAATADRRADLDLQVSLLSEHEVTQLITLVRAIAERLGVEESRDPELPELERDVDPEQVLDVMEATQRRILPDEEPT